MTGINNKFAPSFRAGFYHLDGEPKAMPFSRKDFYKIWLMNGQGILRFANRRIPIDKPALAFFNPLVPYAFEASDKKRTGYWCVFTEEFLVNNTRQESLQESALFKTGTDNVFFPDTKHLTVIKFLFEQIIADFNSEYVYKYDSIKHHVSLLIHEGMKIQPVSGRGQRHNAAFRITGLFLNLLEKQFPIETPQQPLKLKKPGDFASELAVHVNHLNAMVQEVTGKTTSTHITERIINEGTALLNYSDWSIADIAYSLGFEYPNHFNTFFKRHTGITPLSLRK